MINVLFVDVDNACRSQMAEAFANMDGQQAIKAYSAGARPSGTINPAAVKSMHDIGYDLSVHVCKGLDEVPDIEYDLVVTMGGRACPGVSASCTLDWDITDPKAMTAGEFAEVRDWIRAKVLDLIESALTGN